MKIITELRHTSDRNKSQIRLYCDNDRRWKERKTRTGYRDDAKYAERYLPAILFTANVRFHSGMVRERTPVCWKPPAMGATYFHLAKLPKNARAPSPGGMKQVEHLLIVHLAPQKSHRVAVTVRLPLLPGLPSAETPRLIGLYSYVTKFSKREIKK